MARKRPIRDGLRRTKHEVSEWLYRHPPLWHVSDDIRRFFVMTFQQSYQCMVADTILFSYSKSGSTWMRTILAKYYSLIYDVPFTIDLHKKLHPKLPRIAFAHLLKYSRFGKGKRFIFLFRDPRDILVSFYFHRHFRARLNTFDGTLSEFIRDKSEHGVKNLVRWRKEVPIAAKLAKSSHYARYEDMRKDIRKEIIRLIRFLRIRLDEDKVDEVIKFTEFKNMQKLEKKRQLNFNMFHKHDTSDVKTYHIRKGKVGGYKEELSAEDIAYIDKAVKGLPKIPIE